MATPSQLIGAAEAFIGTKYRWSGHNPSTGLDCVGLVEAAYAKIGIAFPSSGSMPWTVQYLFDHWTGTKLLARRPMPGNVLILADRTGTLVHTGIAIDNNYFVSALVPTVAIARISAIVGERLAYVLTDPRITEGVIVPTPTIPPAPIVTQYRVLAGDGWIVIARKFGTTANLLATLNQKTTAYVLHPGDVITVPVKK